MSAYVEQAAEFNISVIRGQKKVIPFLNWTRDEASFNLEGLDIRMDVKGAIEPCRYQDLTLRVGSGIEVNGNDMEITIPTDTIKLKSDTYFYDIVIDDTVYIRGKLNLSGRVTK